MLSKQQRLGVVGILDFFLRAFFRAKCRSTAMMGCCWSTRSLRCCQAHHWIEVTPVRRHCMYMAGRILVGCAVRIIMFVRSFTSSSFVFGSVSCRCRGNGRRFCSGMMHRVSHLRVAHPPTGCHVLRTVRFGRRIHRAIRDRSELLLFVGQMMRSRHHVRLWIHHVRVETRRNRSLIVSIHVSVRIARFARQCRLNASIVSIGVCRRMPASWPPPWMMSITVPMSRRHSMGRCKSTLLSRSGCLSRAGRLSYSRLLRFDGGIPTPHDIFGAILFLSKRMSLRSTKLGSRIGHSSKVLLVNLAAQKRAIDVTGFVQPAQLQFRYKLPGFLLCSFA